MAKYRPIKTQFWTDDWIATLSPNEKLIYLYLITNPNTSLCGIYRVSIRYLVFEIGLTKQVIESALERFKKDDKVVFVNDWIIIKNFEKHQTRSPKIAEGIKRELAEIPQHIAEMRYHIDTVSIGTDKPVPELVLKPLLKPNLKENSKSATPPQVFQEGSEELRLSKLLLERILAFNDRFRTPDLQKWSADIDKMLRIDKRSVEEIETLILWASQDSFWKANILSTHKLREKFDQLWSKAVATQQAKQRTHLIIP